MQYNQQRAEELTRRWREVQQTIAEAAADHSGARTESSAVPELMVVTKFFPASDVAALYDAGVRRVGENRDQEASAKAAQLREEHLDAAADPLCWSFIGQLQSNKAKSVVKYATEVHSVDRASLVKSLAKAYANQLSRYEAEEAPAPAAHARGALDCLIQVNLDQHASPSAGHAAEGQRGGTSVDEVLQLAELIEAAEGLRCAGVMAVAPLRQDPDPAFERLFGISQRLREEHPQADQISAGMSGDLESAIRWGSTVVRVGSQIMGPRPQNV